MAISKAAQQDRLGTQLLTKATETGDLTVGANLRAVKFLERALQTVGFDPGTRDSRFTAETAKALREFQAAWGLPATGRLDRKTLAKLDHTLGRARKHGSTCPDCNQKGFQGTIGVGQKNLDAYNAEQKLKKLGYDVGKVDGVFDRQTARAVKQFKRDENLVKKGEEPSSLVGKKAMAALGKAAGGLDHAAYRQRQTNDQKIKERRRLNEATAKAAAATNDKGVTGVGEGSGKRVVANVQAHLKAAGFDPSRTDGVWNDRTENALKVFQRKAGLKETGRVGPRTWAELRKSLFAAKDGTSPAQRLGERSAAVLKTEKMLKKLGYGKVKVDGVFDRATQQASRKFEKKYRGTGDDGRIGDHQLKRMRQVLTAKEHPGQGPLLKKGFRGKPVRMLQRRLANMGFKPGGVDGAFGAKTKAAVKRFQRAFGLEVDGVVGKKTWRMLAVRAQGKVVKPGQVSGGGGVNDGKGWGGSEGVADTAKRIAGSMGIPVTSQKRNYAQTIAVGSTTASDHYTGNTTAFAVDFGVSGSRGDELARRICQAYGISTSNLGTFNGPVITVDGARYRIQVLWRVAGHFDHVHVGIRRA